MPYAIVMNCSTLWFERFTALPLPKPTWYDDSVVPFSRETFLNFLTRFENICYQMTERFDDSGQFIQLGFLSLSAAGLVFRERGRNRGDRYADD